MRTIHWLSLFALISFVACKKEKMRPAEPDNSRLIRWDDPKVGQSNQYLLFKGEQYFEPESGAPWSYLPDTLAVEIIAREGEKFRLREYLLPGSASLNSEDPFLAKPEATYEYWMGVRNDTLWLEVPGSSYPVRSHLFLAGNLTFLPFAVGGSVSYTFDGWRTSPPNCGCREEGVADHLDLFGRRFLELQVVIDNEPMTYDGSGYTAVYRPDFGLLRFYAVNPWFQAGTGWDLLP